MRNDEYDELPVFCDEDTPIDLWVRLRSGDGEDVIVLKNVSPPTKYRGWWLVSHDVLHHYLRMTAFIKADDVLYFDVLEHSTSETPFKDDDDNDD